ncbi:hypothetical protein B0H14DRAFT_2638968 [Mycena olivaceomarginata]|nr:hypothetical protein B0H14DRAFT_2638968 [Mycena olivaceomarginata]
MAVSCTAMVASMADPKRQCIFPECVEENTSAHIQATEAQHGGSEGAQKLVDRQRNGGGMETASGESGMMLSSGQLSRVARSEVMFNVWNAAFCLAEARRRESTKIAIRKVEETVARCLTHPSIAGVEDEAIPAALHAEPSVREMNPVVERCEHDREVARGDRLRRGIKLGVAHGAPGAVAVRTPRDGDDLPAERVELHLEAEVVGGVLELDDVRIVEGVDAPDLEAAGGEAQGETTTWLPSPVPLGVTQRVGVEDGVDEDVGDGCFRDGTDAGAEGGGVGGASEPDGEGNERGGFEL